MFLDFRETGQMDQWLLAGISGRKAQASSQVKDRIGAMSSRVSLSRVKMVCWAARRSGASVRLQYRLSFWMFR